jgi:hypothetical protein
VHEKFALENTGILAGDHQKHEENGARVHELVAPRNRHAHRVHRRAGCSSHRTEARQTKRPD